MSDQETLPYRTTGDDLKRFVSACARGRDMDQIQSLFTSTPNFRGTTSAAEVLGLYSAELEELTSLGKRLSRGDSDEAQKALLSSVLDYEAYELLLEAVFASGISQEDGTKYTPLEWIESWWEDNGYGSSQTNRSEGSTAFAKIIDYLNLGEYKQGRHGHPSRIEWIPDAETKIDEARNQINDDTNNDKPFDDEKGPTSDVRETENSLESRPENNSLTLNFSDDRIARLSLPSTLTKSEKKRLVSLVKLMISIDEEGGASQMEMEL